MATNTRQSLKDLQERLAARLSDAKQSGVDAAWLAVEAGGQHYLLPLAHAGEIFPPPVIQPVPHTQPWFLGVASLRGGLMAVVSLAGLLLPNRPPSALSSRQEAKIVAFNAALGVNAALWVDRLVGLRHASAFVGVVPRQPQDTPACHQRLTDTEGAEWQELNLQALAQWPGFLSVVA